MKILSTRSNRSAYFFLTNGWKLRSWEGNHTLTVSGNLFVDGGAEFPFVPTIGNWTVLVTLQVSPQSQTVSTGIGTAEEVKEVIWGSDLDEYDTQDDTAGQDIKDIKRNTGLIPATL